MDSEDKGKGMVFCLRGIERKNHQAIWSFALVALLHTSNKYDKRLKNQWMIAFVSTSSLEGVYREQMHDFNVVFEIDLPMFDGAEVFLSEATDYS